MADETKDTQKPLTLESMAAEVALQGRVLNDMLDPSSGVAARRGRHDEMRTILTGFSLAGLLAHDHGLLGRDGVPAGRVDAVMVDAAIKIADAALTKLGY